MRDQFNDAALREWAQRQAAKAAAPDPEKARKVAAALDNGWAKKPTDYDPEVLARRVARMLETVDRTPDGGCWLVTNLKPARRTAKRDYYTLGLAMPGRRRVAMSIQRAVWLVNVGPLASNEFLRSICKEDRCVNPGHLEVFASGRGVAS